MARYLLTHPLLAGTAYGLVLGAAGLLFWAGWVVGALALLASLAFVVAEVARADGWAEGYEAGQRAARAGTPRARS